MKIAGDIFFYATFVGYLTFIIAFFWSHWWRSAIGQHVFAFMFVPTVLFGLGIARRLIGDTWFEAHRDALVFWSYLAMAIVVWWRVVILIAAQRFDSKAASLRELTPRSDYTGKDGDTDPNLTPIT